MICIFHDLEYLKTININKGISMKFGYYRKNTGISYNILECTKCGRRKVVFKEYYFGDRPIEEIRGLDTELRIGFNIEMGGLINESDVTPPESIRQEVVNALNRGELK